MLAEFMTAEAVVAALGKPVEFSRSQITFVADALKKPRCALDVFVSS
jgi:hypothetical protein